MDRYWPVSRRYFNSNFHDYIRSQFVATPKHVIMKKLYKNPTIIAFLLVLQIISFFTTICLFLSFVMTLKDIDSGKLQVFSFRVKHKCILCGMTHSFCAISHNQHGQAKEYNKYGLVLYRIFFIITVVGFILIPVSIKSIRILNNNHV